MRYLVLLLVVLAGCRAVERAPARPSTCASGESCSYCDADTWGGMAPTASSDLRIPSGQTITMDCEGEARTLTIDEGGTLLASRAVSSTLTMHGNLVNRGTMDYGTPTDRIPESVTAELVFQGMRDSDYAGTTSPYIDEEGSTMPIDTPMVVVDSDVGLWVMGEGRFFAAGEEKRAWGTLLEGAAPGDRSFTVDDASGWRVGDRVALTPTGTVDGAADFYAQFDEGVISAVDGNTITLSVEPTFAHAGCTDCTRRGEAANLSRNVVVRSFDDSAHAHIMIADQAVAQLDSVELRWLGPEKCGGPDRRAPLWFHQQFDASEDSFVRHVSIWGGQHHFLMDESSNGIELDDIAGYDAYDVGFRLFFDQNACATRCLDRELKSPKRIVMNHILAARDGVPLRDEGCVRIDHRMTGIDATAGEGTGIQNSVATGIGFEGAGEDVSGFRWGEGGTGRPVDFVFNNNVAHDIHGNGALIWHNGMSVQQPYEDNAFWSVSARGIHWGAYDNAFQFTNLLVSDSGDVSVGVKAIPSADRTRIVGATVDSMGVLAYVFVQTNVAVFEDVTFTGARPIGVTQIHEACVGGNEDDPNDSDCIRVWLRFVNPHFPAGMVPFDFGTTFNRHSVWEIRGFESPDYPELPTNFDLYRPDSTEPGGSFFAPFNAWLVPRT